MIIELSAGNFVNLQNSVKSNFIILSVTNRITLNVTNQYSPVAESIDNSLRFSNATSYGFKIYNSSVATSITFSTTQHHHSEMLVVENTISFRHSAIIAKYEVVANTINFNHNIVVIDGYGFSTTLSFNSVLDYDIIRTKIIINSLFLGSKVNIYKMDKTFSMYPEIVPPLPE